MTREQAKEFALSEINKFIQKEGLDGIVKLAPKLGKNFWTAREYLEAIEQDECMEENSNPIDDVLNLEKYLNERGKSLLE